MSYRDTWTAAELVGKRTHWLLDITFAGRIYRLAETSLSMTSTTLGVLQYSPCITNDLTVKYGFSLFGDTAEQQSVTIETFMEDSDVAALIAAGHDLAGSPCQLSKWIEGQDYDDRRVFVIGRLKNPVYGGRGVPVTATLEDAFFDDWAIIPDNDAQVTKATTDLTKLDKDDWGLTYPIVIGNPGRCAGIPVGWCTGSQGIWRNKVLNTQELMIAGHETNIARVILSNESYTAGAVYSTALTTDLSGRVITVIPSAYGQAVTALPSIAGLNGYGARPEYLGVYNDADATLNMATSVYVAWYTGDDTETTGGLVQNGQLVRGAGDVLGYVLSFSRYRFDTKRVQAVANDLNSYLIDCTIDDQVRPWDWVRQNLVPILPVSVCNGTNGIYFVPWKVGAVATDAVCALDEDANPEVAFANTVQTDTQQISNHLCLNYALDIRTGAYQQTVQMDWTDTNNYSAATLVSLQTAQIKVIAKERGAAGQGIVIKVDGAASGVTDDVFNRKVTVSVNGPDALTARQVINLINNQSNLIRAELQSGDETNILNGDYNIDGTPGFLTTAFAQTVTLDGTHEIVIPSLYSMLSHQRYQYVSGNGSGEFYDSLNSAVVYDPATAAAVLAWRMQAFAFGHKFLEGVAPENTHGWMQVGDVVTVTSSRLAFDRQVGMVQQLEYSNDGFVAFRIAIIEDPLRDPLVS